MPYYIKGYTNQPNSRLIILNESDWSVEIDNPTVSGYNSQFGNYEIEVADENKKLVAFILPDGEVIARGNITPFVVNNAQAGNIDPDFHSSITTINPDLYSGTMGCQNYATLNGNVRGLPSKSTGKWYWEVRFPNGITYQMVGIAKNSADLSTPFWNNSKYIAMLYVLPGGCNIYSLITGYAPAYTTNTWIGVAVDLDNRYLQFNVNGTWYASYQYNVPGEDVVPAMTLGSAVTSPFEVNFGQSAFNYSVPEGYNAGWTI